MTEHQVKHALELLDIHYETFDKAAPLAKETGHPVPVDTRAWSQVLVSILCGIKGLERQKGTDLSDGSDVKGAITWEAIDTPRFNGVIKAGTKAVTAGHIESLDGIPHLFLVLWDKAPNTNNPRCRVWCVRPQKDEEFRKMCAKWYDEREKGTIKSNNFQLHPPRNKNSNIIRNTCGVFEYPLLFQAERINERFQLIKYDPSVLDSGACKKV